MGALDEQHRHYLSLRGGLDGPPRSRGQAAHEMGISRRKAARLEREGMRSLRAACGSGSGTVTSAGAASTLAASGSMPALQPAVLLERAGGGRPLVSPQRLAGRQEVRGARKSSGKPPPGSSVPSTAATTHPVAAATTSGASAIWIVLAAALILTSALTVLPLRGVVVRRHRAQAATAGAATAGAATAEPPPVAPVPAPSEPEERAAPAEEAASEEAVDEPAEAAAPVPAETTPVPAGDPEIAHAAEEFHRRHLSRPVAVGAAGVLSFLVRAFLKRRGHSGGRGHSRRRHR
jgi:hypothetical protein